jgi:hypothetical protein
MDLRVTWRGSNPVRDAEWERAHSWVRRDFRPTGVRLCGVHLETTDHS